LLEIQVPNKKAQLTQKSLG